jgi:hypothetical protein
VWEPSSAAAIVGLAVLSVCTLYKENAPSLSDLRDASSDGGPTHQHLQDADLTVGALGLITGLAMAWLTRDPTALLLIVVALGAYMLGFHAVLNRNPTLVRINES